MDSVRACLLGASIFLFLPACGGGSGDDDDAAGRGGTSNPAAGDSGAGGSSGGQGGAGLGGSGGMNVAGTAGAASGGKGDDVGGSAGMSGSAGTMGLADDPTGITADRDCALAQAGTCLKPMTRTKDEACKRWAADFTKRAESVYVPSDLMCDPGETTLDAQDDAVRRQNLVRWLAGLGPVALNADWSSYASACAVIQAYLAPDISHFPDASAPCYTEKGGTASSQSELAGAAFEPADSMMALIWDFGDNNHHILGHRHGILLPGAQDVGVGSSFPKDALGATCVRMTEGVDPLRPPGLDGAVAFPPWGVVPYDLVDSANYPSVDISPLEWSVETGDDIKISGIRMYHQTESGYEPFAIESGEFLKPTYHGRYIDPGVNPVPPGTYVVVVDTEDGGAFGYRTELDRCGPDLPLTCDVFAQDCGVPGYGCYQAASPVCAESGSTPVGQPCTGLDVECVPGAACKPSGFGEYACTQYCDNMDPTSPKSCDTLCPNHWFVVVGVDGGAVYCEPGAGGSCNPLAPMCDDGQSCYDFDPALCGPTGTLKAGDECVRGLTENCVPGYTCAGIQGEDFQYCVPYCDPSPTATGANACSTLCPDMFWDYDTYGVCLPTK